MQLNLTDSLKNVWKSKVYDIDKKRHSIRPIENRAALVKEAFDEVSKGVESVDSIRVKMNNKGLKLTKQGFYNMLRNVAYIGKIRVKAYKKDDEVVVLGAHLGIIREDLFMRVQTFLSGRRRGNTMPTHRNLNFPLRNFLQCSECGENLTASESKGRLGGRYGYYHCRKSCKSRIPVLIAHNYFSALLRSLTVHESITLTLAEILKDSFGSNELHRKLKKKQLIERLEALNAMIASTEDRFIANDISKDRFDDIVSRYDAQKLDLNFQIEELNCKGENPINYFAMAQTVLTGLDKLYQSLDYDLKRVLIGSIFPEKIQISKEACRTTNTNQVVSFLTNNIKELEGVQKKKATKNGGLSNLAPPSGLEPETL